jgi:hypothetical protein
MAQDTAPAARSDINAAPYGSGYLLPLIGSIALALIWGGYTIWVSLEIISLTGAR